MLFEMTSDDGDICGGEDERSQAREEDRNAIESLNSDTSCRVSSVAPCKARGEERKDCSPVGSEASKNVRAITVDATDNTNMFSGICEGDESSINIDWRDDLRIVHKMFTAWWGESQELGLLRYKGDVVPLAVVKSEEEEILKTVDVISLQGTVIRLANTGYNAAAKIYSKV